MDSSLLKHHIEIYELVTTTSEYGTIQRSYDKKYDTRAYIKFDSQTQVVSEGEIYYPINRTFIVRGYVPVLETDRIKWNGQWWRITSVNPNIYYNNIEVQTTLVNE